MYLFLFVHILQCCMLLVHSCPSLCLCVYQNGSNGTRLRFVSCRDRRMSLIPSDAPADTVKFRLEKTAISRVPRAAFFYLSELQYLWLTYNAIITIHPSSFVNLKVLRELRLDGNLLLAFPWEALRDMPHLRSLSLHNNRLSSLPAQSSLFLSQVTYLDLSSNRLTTLPSELLDVWLPLPRQSEELTLRRVLGLHDNPWLCECQISVLTTLPKFPGSPVFLMDQLLFCSMPDKQPGVSQTDPSQCMRPSVQPLATKVTSLLGSNVILRCDAIGHPTPTISWTKVSVLNTECCQQLDNKTTSENLPRSLDSFMQESPRVGSRWSIISLNGISSKDAGEYRCQAQNMAGKAEAYIRLKVVGFYVPPSSIKIKTQTTPFQSSLNYNKSLVQNSKQTSAIIPKSDPPEKTRTLKPLSFGNKTLKANSDSEVISPKKRLLNNSVKKRKHNNATIQNQKENNRIKLSQAKPFSNVKKKSRPKVKSQLTFIGDNSTEY